VFKLSNSNYSIWNENITNSDDLKKQIKLFESALISNYKDIDVLYEIIIKEGYSLNAKIESLKYKSNQVYKISDDLRQLYVCLDKKIDSNIITELKLTTEDIFVCLDSALDDSFKLNLSKILKSNEFNNNLRTM
jgi:adenine-specific DNA-methyltransferase